jgi:hypothetical protein
MRNLFLLIFCLALTIGASAQDKTVTISQVWNVFGNATDTVKKNSTDTYTIYAKPFAENVKFRPTLTRTSGTYTKARVILQTSLDNSNWVAKDTVSFAGTGASQTGISDLVTPKDAYVRIKITPYDSTQVIKYKYTILTQLP